MSRTDPHSTDSDVRRLRRLALLEALREAAELRARTGPARGASSAAARCCTRATRVADVAFRRLVRGETSRTRST